MVEQSLYTRMARRSTHLFLMRIGVRVTCLTHDQTIGVQILGPHRGFKSLVHTEELIQLAELRWERFNDFISVLELNHLEDCEYGYEFQDLAEDLKVSTI